MNTQAINQKLNSLRNARMAFDVGKTAQETLESVIADLKKAGFEGDAPAQVTLEDFGTPILWNYLVSEESGLLAIHGDGNRLYAVRDPFYGVNGDQERWSYFRADLILTEIVNGLATYTVNSKKEATETELDKDLFKFGFLSTASGILGLASIMDTMIDMANGKPNDLSMMEAIGVGVAAYGWIKAYQWGERIVQNVRQNKKPTPPVPPSDNSYNYRLGVDAIPRDIVLEHNLLRG